MPCKGGYRASIEAGKKNRELERAYRQTAEYKYWQALVERVHGASGSFQALAPAEKTYFAVNCLIGEVYNGGFDQFFSNSTGDLYAYALDGLYEMEAELSASQLVSAKQVLFGESPVPLEQGERWARMRTVDSSAALDALDTAFYEDRDDLAARCKRFAAEHALYEDG